MGDFSIKGDERHEHHHYAPAPPATEATSTASVVTEKRRNGLAKIAAIALLGAALPVAGAAGLAVYNHYFDKPDSVTTINPANEHELNVGIRLDN